ncbi:MAG: PP2C family protein-serine/threonine phosphatase [Armatimonadota bacterium]
MPNAMRPPEAHQRGENTDLFVALIRAAVVIALILAFTYNSHLPGDILALRSPLFLQVAWVLAAAFTVLVFVGLWVGLDLNMLRPVALCIDLCLLTAIVASFGELGSNLFETYYLLIIIAAIWYRRSGALTVAAVALGLSVWADYQITGDSVHTLLAEMLWSRLPLFMLVAVTTGYLVRALEQEREQNVQINHELRLARRLQREMLPESLPDPPGYDIGLRFSPARYVGGDLYLLQMQDSDRMLLTLADMAGRSVYGLVHLSALNSHLRTAIADDEPVDEIARRINRGTYEVLQPDSFAAVFIASLQLSTGAFTFVNCGHLPPMLLREGDPDRAEELHSGGILIGAVQHPDYTPDVTTIEPGDLLVCCTDGISEARNHEGRQFGQEHILQVIGDTPDLSLGDLASKILEESDDFAASPTRDDATVILLRRKKCETSPHATDDAPDSADNLNV